MPRIKVKSKVARPRPDVHVEPGAAPKPKRGPAPNEELFALLDTARETYPNETVLLKEYESNHGYRVAARINRGEIDGIDLRRWEIWATGETVDGVMKTKLWGQWSSRPRKI